MGTAYLVGRIHLLYPVKLGSETYFTRCIIIDSKTFCEKIE